MGLGMKATLISIARQGIFLIPALLILPRVFGLLGLQMAQPIADLCTAIFAFFIVHKVMQELKNRRTSYKPAYFSPPFITEGGVSFIHTTIHTTYSFQFRPVYTAFFLVKFGLYAIIIHV